MVVCTEAWPSSREICAMPMPCSSQLLMVAAFAGYEETMHAYEEAVKEGYHFGDYGDAMLIVD